MRFSKMARSSSVRPRISTSVSRVFCRSSVRSRVMVRLKLGRLSAMITPLRSKMIPRVGGIGCTWTRLFSDSVEWYSYWVTCRWYMRATSTKVSKITATAPTMTRRRTRRASFSWSFRWIGCGIGTGDYLW